MSIAKYFIGVKETVRNFFTKEPKHLNVTHNFANAKDLHLFTCKKFEVAEPNLAEKFLCKDLTLFRKKLSNIRNDGISELQIVSDFDHTLTKSFYKGKPALACFALFRESSHVSEELKKEIAKHYEYYYAIEINPHISSEDKHMHMREWVEKAVLGLLREKMTKNRFEKILNESSMVLRYGIDDLLLTAARHNLPFYVISGGISDICATIIYQRLQVEDYRELTIYSNEMFFDAEGNLTGFKKPVVHSHSKPNLIHKSKSYRKNVLLLGDIVEDSKMANNIKARSQINIGFFNDLKKDNTTLMRHYMNHFDVVIVDEGDLTLPSMILKNALGEGNEEQIIEKIERNFYNNNSI